MSTKPGSNANPEAGLALVGVRGLARLLAHVPRTWGPILAVAWYAFIFVLSSQQGTGRPGPIASNWALNTGHALIFGLLGLWILIGIPRRDGWPIVQRANAAWVLGAVLVLGVLDELHQRTVPGRAMSVADVITDVSGAACVLWMCAYAASPYATERGTRTRFLIGMAACSLAGALATLADN